LKDITRNDASSAAWADKADMINIIKPSTGPRIAQLLLFGHNS
jgi:hypothetical protein